MITNSILEFFNDVITILKYDEANDKYDSYYINKTYWFGTDSMQQSGKGVNTSNRVNIVVAKESIEEAKIANVGDLAVNGKITFKVNSITELTGYDYIKITNIDHNTPLTSLGVENIMITGV